MVFQMFARALWVKYLFSDCDFVTWWLDCERIDKTAWGTYGSARMGYRNRYEQSKGVYC